MNPSGPGNLTPLPSPPRSSPVRRPSAADTMSTPEVEGMTGLVEGEQATEENGTDEEVVIMEQDQDPTRSTSFAPPSNSNNSARRSTRNAVSGGGGNRRATGTNRPSGSHFERERFEIERRDGRGSGTGGGSNRNEESRLGSEQNIWDKVLDKQYTGAITFDPFQELVDHQNSIAGASEAAVSTDDSAATTLASPSA